MRVRNCLINFNYEKNKTGTTLIYKNSLCFGWYKSLKNEKN